MNFLDKFRETCFNHFAAFICHLKRMAAFCGLFCKVMGDMKNHKNLKTDGPLVSIEKKLQLRVPYAFHKLCEGFDKIYNEEGEEAMMKAIGIFAEGMYDPEGRTLKG